jgi:hypothetical protein
MNNVTQDVMVDDIIQMILAEAGFENPMNSHKFDYSDFCNVIHKHYESVSILKNKLSFCTSWTFPHSSYINRVFLRMEISKVFMGGWMAGGTKEYQRKNFESLRDADRNAIKQIAEELKIIFKLV